jgi:hypothetical protein
LDEKTAEQIKDDFLCWSGGLPPESELEISTFVEYARDVQLDAPDVAKVLRDWLKALRLDSKET